MIAPHKKERVRKEDATFPYRVIGKGGMNDRIELNTQKILHAEIGSTLGDEWLAI